MKKYGLQLRVPPSQQKKQPARPPLPNSLGFQDDDNDVEKEISRQASKNKALKDTEEKHKKALEEDPSVFDYDGVYDDMKQKAIRPRAQDQEERKPKYIQALIEKAKQREREHEIIYEKKLAKERSQDDHLYADKDKFVTGAYKRKLAEQAKWIKEERLRELREAKEDVTKKTDISDFYFNLSKNVAFGGGEADLNQAQKQQEEVVRSSEIVSMSAHSDSSSMIKRHQSDASRTVSNEEKFEKSDANALPDVSSQEKVKNEPSAGEQSGVDHHKRKEDALAAAKERFLARKRAK